MTIIPSWKEINRALSIKDKDHLNTLVTIQMINQDFSAFKPKKQFSKFFHVIIQTFYKFFENKKKKMLQDFSSSKSNHFQFSFSCACMLHQTKLDHAPLESRLIEDTIDRSSSFFFFMISRFSISCLINIIWWPSVSWKGGISSFSWNDDPSSFFEESDSFSTSSELCFFFKIEIKRICWSFAVFFIRLRSLTSLKIGSMLSSMLTVETASEHKTVKSNLRVW